MTRRDFFPECKRATALLYELSITTVVGGNMLYARVGKLKTYSFRVYFPAGTIIIACERELS
jgi:hypothetical protein